MNGDAGRRVAYADTHESDPRVFLAEDETILSRVLAVKLVAATSPATLGQTDLDAIRRALLEERWADAVALWISTTGNYVDAYPSERVWNEHDLDEERTSLELRVAPIFDDGG
jgi:hypothetical protein